MKASDLSELEKSLGYEFKDKGLLIEALTHKSYSASPHNERLEFLGDSVVGLAVVDYLFGADEAMRESIMSKIKSSAVKRNVLSEAAGGLSLGGYLRVGKGEEETGGRRKPSILSDAMEAVVGAVYIDGGFDGAKSLVLRLLKGKLDALIASGEFHDYKTELQEACQLKFGVLPEYRTMKEEGEEHEKMFTVHVFIRGESRGIGRGKSKKEAEAKAAKEALAETGK